MRPVALRGSVYPDTPPAAPFRQGSSVTRDVPPGPLGSCRQLVFSCLRLTRAALLACTLCGVVVACGSPHRYQILAATRVGRHEAVVTGDAAYDRYFAVVHAIQRSLDVVDRRRAEPLAALAEAVELPRTADAPDVADAVHERLALVGSPGARIALEVSPAFQEALEQWMASVALEPGDPSGTRFERVERSIDARVTLVGGARGGMEPVLLGVERVVRRASALERTMELLPIIAADVRRRAPRATTRTPVPVRWELESAELFLAGVRARASSQEAESRRVVELFRAALEPHR